MMAITTSSSISVKAGRDDCGGRRGVINPSVLLSLRFSLNKQHDTNVAGSVKRPSGKVPTWVARPWTGRGSSGRRLAQSSPFQDMDRGRHAEFAWFVACEEHRTPSGVELLQDRQDGAGRLPV